MPAVLLKNTGMQTSIYISNGLRLCIFQAGIHLFVEKPLSIRPAAEVSQLAQRLGELQKEHDIIIAVGEWAFYELTTLWSLPN